MYMYSSLEQHPQVPPNCRLIETMLDDQWDLGVTNSSRGAVDFLPSVNLEFSKLLPSLGSGSAQDGPPNDNLRNKIE